MLLASLLVASFKINKANVSAPRASNSVKSKDGLEFQQYLRNAYKGEGDLNREMLSEEEANRAKILVDRDERKRLKKEVRSHNVAKNKSAFLKSEAKKKTKQAQAPAESVTKPVTKQVVEVKKEAVCSERAKLSRYSNTCRGNHSASSNCTLCDWQTSRLVATHFLCRIKAYRCRSCS